MAEQIQPDPREGHPVNDFISQANPLSNIVKTEQDRFELGQLGFTDNESDGILGVIRRLPGLEEYQHGLEAQNRLNFVVWLRRERGLFDEFTV